MVIDARGRRPGNSTRAHCACGVGPHLRAPRPAVQRCKPAFQDLLDRVPEGATSDLPKIEAVSGLVAGRKPAHDHRHLQKLGNESSLTAARITPARAYAGTRTARPGQIRSAADDDVSIAPRHITAMASTACCRPGTAPRMPSTKRDRGRSGLCAGAHRRAPELISSIWKAPRRAPWRRSARELAAGASAARKQPRRDHGRRDREEAET